MFCMWCGTRLDAAARFCPMCGGPAPVGPAPVPAPWARPPPPFTGAPAPAQAVPPPVAAWAPPAPVPPRPVPAGNGLVSLNVVGMLFVLTAAVLAGIAVLLGTTGAHDGAAVLYILSAILFLTAGFFFHLGRPRPEAATSPAR